MAKYLKLKQLLAKMLNSPIIVEHGQEGIWTYRKWSNGMAECWGYVSGTVDVTTAWGSGLYTGLIGTPTYPTNFFYSVPQIWVSSQPVSAYASFAYLANNGTVDSPGDIRLTRGSSATSQQYKVHIYAIGKWAEINPTTQEMTATSYSQTQMTKAEIQALIEASGNQFKDNDTWIPSDLT